MKVLKLSMLDQRCPSDVFAFGTDNYGEFLTIDFRRPAQKKKPSNTEFTHAAGKKLRLPVFKKVRMTKAAPRPKLFSRVKRVYAASRGNTRSFAADMKSLFPKLPAS